MRHQALGFLKALKQRKGVAGLTQAVAVRKQEVRGEKRRVETCGEGSFVETQ